MNLALLPLALVLFSVHGAEADLAKQENGDAKRLAVVISVIRDGGSRMIRIPMQGAEPGCLIRVDLGIGTKTPGEIYLVPVDPGSTEKGPLSRGEAEAYLKRIERALLDHYGPEKVLEIALNPIEPGTHFSEEEFGKKLGSDADFADRLNAQHLIQEIVSYRAARRD